MQYGKMSSVLIQFLKHLFACLYFEKYYSSETDPSEKTELDKKYVMRLQFICQMQMT